MKVLLAIVLVGVAAASAGCGSSNQSTAFDAESGEIAASDWAALERAAGGQASQLIVPSGPPPEEIVIEDLRVGAGRELEPKSPFTVKYIAWDYATGLLQQTSWDSPLEATWRVSELVDAWDVGLVGMRAGGVRELIAPSSLTYGDGALVYLIRLIEVGAPGTE